MRFGPASVAVLLLAACGDDTSSASDDGTDGGTADSSTDASASSTADGSCEAALELQCEPAVQVECTGPQTTVSLPTPSVQCEDWTLEDDAPKTFGLGETDVEFTVRDGASRASCITTVSVGDETPPSLRCPADQTVALLEPGAGVSVPEAVATDACDETPLVEVDPPSSSERGTTTLTYTATDSSGNTASCTTELRLVEAFAPSGFRIISASATEGRGTTVTLAWEPSPSAAVSGVRIETADDPDGPWSEVATVGADEQLFTHALETETAWFRAVAVTNEVDGGATPARRAFGIRADTYDIPDVDVPNLGFDTTLYGVVRYPSALDEGPFPLVVALHGNHGNCRDNAQSSFDYCVTSPNHTCADAGGVTTPNAEGYTYFLETLAAQGYIAVSISGNAMNCRDDFIFERAELIGEHLRRWSSWNENDAPEIGASFEGHVDLSRVGLVGHSRGGDAVSHVPDVLAADPIPGVDVRSIFAVAPTDFHQAQIEGVDFGVLLPGCDGDVVSLAGMNHYDRSTRLDDGARRAQVFFVGANHNFFNTQWQVSEWDLFGNPNDPFCTPPDDPQKRAQTTMLEATLGSWFDATLASPQTPEPFVRASAPSPSSFDAWAQQPLQMRWSYSSDTRVLIDDFEAPDAPSTNALGQPNTFEDWFEFEACSEFDCGPFFLHLRTVARLLWQLPSEPLATLRLGDYDAARHDALTMRVASRRSTLNQGLEENDFFVRLRDSQGRTAQLALSDAKPLRHLYPHQDPREVLETFSLPLAWFLLEEPRLDLGSLQAIEFDMTATGQDGSVLLGDLEFTD